MFDQNICSIQSTLIPTLKKYLIIHQVRRIHKTFHLFTLLIKAPHKIKN